MSPGPAPPVRARSFLALGLVLGLTTAAGCARIESGIYQAGLNLERTRAGLDALEVDTGHERLAYLYRDGPGPRVVMLHGFASQKDIWIQMIQELPGEFAVTALDLPGHGDSSRELERDYSVTGLAAAVARGIEALESEPVHLLGSSLGGAVAVAVASRYPHLVRSLGLISPAGAPDALSPALREGIEAGDHPLVVEDREDFERMVELVFHDPPIMPWPTRRVITRMHARRTELHRRIWTDVWENRQPAAPLLQRIDVPVLLVWGEHDRVLERDSVDFFRAHLADLEVVILAGSGHSPMIEEPEDTAAHYERFVQRIR